MQENNDTDLTKGERKHGKIEKGANNAAQSK
jgi:hypothetical protein